MTGLERLNKVITAALTMQRWPWEQGVLAQALLEVGKEELTILFAKEAVTNQYKDGRLAMKTDRYAAADPASNGEPVLFAAGKTGDNRLKAAADRMLDYLLYRAPKTREGILFHNENEGMIWADAYYMVPPFLAVAGYPEEAVKQIWGFKKYLWNEENSLLSHMWDYDNGVFVRKDFWGVGNGWAAAGMARVIKALPDSMTDEKNKIAVFVKQLLDGCFKYRRADGLFHNVLDKPETFVETNLAQMLAYTIYRGIKQGWLDEHYLDRADKCREAVYKKVDEYGLVQGVCGSPDFNRPGTAVEGQAFYILMETAYNDM